jgi:hypothetical protein
MDDVGVDPGDDFGTERMPGTGGPDPESEAVREFYRRQEVAGRGGLSAGRRRRHREGPPPTAAAREAW